MQIWYHKTLCWLPAPGVTKIARMRFVLEGTINGALSCEWIFLNGNFHGFRLLLSCTEINKTRLDWYCWRVNENKYKRLTISVTMRINYELKMKLLYHLLIGNQRGTMIRLFWLARVAIFHNTRYRVPQVQAVKINFWLLCKQNTFCVTFVGALGNEVIECYISIHDRDLLHACWLTLNETWLTRSKAIFRYGTFTCVSKGTILLCRNHLSPHQ